MKIRWRILTDGEKNQADYDGVPTYLEITVHGMVQAAVLEYETTSGEHSAEGPSSEWNVVAVEWP